MFEYMAPEQALDAASADIRADIYSLGCTLYYLIAGVLPFNYDSDAKLLLAHQSEMPRPLCEAAPGTPRELSDLVDRMLAKDPLDRPQTPAEVARALLPFAKGAIVSALPPGEGQGVRVAQVSIPPPVVGQVDNLPPSLEFLRAAIPAKAGTPANAAIGAVPAARAIGSPLLPGEGQGVRAWFSRQFLRCQSAIPPRFRAGLAHRRRGGLRGGSRGTAGHCALDPNQ